MFYILFSKRTSHLTTSIGKNEEILAWYRREILCCKYLSSISQFINYPYCWIYSSYILHKKLNKILQELDWPFVSFWNLKSLYFNCFHTFSFVVPLPVIHRHSLSLVVTRCHSLWLVVTRCTTRNHSLYHLLSFVVTRCHSLSLVVPLVVTRLPRVCLFINHLLNLTFDRYFLRY